MTVKQFFSIDENTYHFEVFDLTALITVLNVAFILMGFWWAPILGLINCVICIICGVLANTHANTYVTQIALIVLNVYFLTM